MLSVTVVSLLHTICICFMITDSNVSLSDLCMLNSTCFPFTHYVSTTGGTKFVPRLVTSLTVAGEREKGRSRGISYRVLFLSVRYPPPLHRAAGIEPSLCHSLLAARRCNRENLMDASRRDSTWSDMPR